MICVLIWLWRTYIEDCPVSWWLSKWRQRPLDELVDCPEVTEFQHHQAVEHFSPEYQLCYVEWVTVTSADLSKNCSVSTRTLAVLLPKIPIRACRLIVDEFTAERCQFYQGNSNINKLTLIMFPYYRYKAIRNLSDECTSESTDFPSCLHECFPLQILTLDILINLSYFKSTPIPFLGSQNLPLLIILLTWKK